MKMKRLIWLCLIISVSFLASCEEEKPTISTHQCIGGEYVGDDSGVKCGEWYEEYQSCTICQKVLNSQQYRKSHDIEEVIENKVCVGEYQVLYQCQNCDYQTQTTRMGKGHEYGEYIVEREATDQLYGLKNRQCQNCDDKITVEYANNTYAYHGKLAVKGTDLVDQSGQTFQLIGLSTHGLQWFGRYVNYESFSAMKNEFGINTIRLSLYTSEYGYCNGGTEVKERMYKLVEQGIEYATQLDLYVIVDWHMLGATDSADANPLTYVQEAKEFFSKISKQYAEYNNILYEIMNEPNGRTTWADCKNYANQVIPLIRANTDAIVLVGNPRWSADLNSVMASPLTGYENIMYTYHFYAGDHRSTTQVVNAYQAGIPVFISEHGGMNSDGDGQLNYQAIRNWYRVLEERNISYVAWSIANSTGTSSMLKTTNNSLIDFSDNGLKVWGRWYKIWTRTKAGLPVRGFVDETTEKE